MPPPVSSPSTKTALIVILITHSFTLFKSNPDSEKERERERVDMASNLSPAFAYTVVYVRDVAKSVAFYASAFGYNVRRLDQSHK
jgi:hypothetical protein